MNDRRIQMHIDLDNLARHGFCVVARVLDGETVSSVASACAAARNDGDDATRQRNERLYAMRNLLRLVPAVRELAASAAVRRIVEPVLGPAARVVRGLLFDKTPEANWKVAYHQDLSIAVRERRDVAGYGPWSEKAGVEHVQPPRGFRHTRHRLPGVSEHAESTGEDGLSSAG